MLRDVKGKAEYKGAFRKIDGKFCCRFLKNGRKSTNKKQSY